MQIDSGLLESMRDRIRPLLPERAFLRRDRGGNLFITNAPAFAAELPSLPGFILEESGGLVRILPDSSWVAEAEAAGPADHLSESLLHFRGKEPDLKNLRLFARGLKIIDMGASVPANELRTYDRAVRQRAALALRGGCGGGLYACALLNHQIIHKGE